MCRMYKYSYACKHTSTDLVQCPWPLSSFCKLIASIFGTFGELIPLHNQKPPNANTHNPHHKPNATITTFKHIYQPIITPQSTNSYCPTCLRTSAKARKAQRKLDARAREERDLYRAKVGAGQDPHDFLEDLLTESAIESQRFRTYAHSNTNTHKSLQNRLRDTIFPGDVCAAEEEERRKTDPDWRHPVLEPFRREIALERRPQYGSEAAELWELEKKTMKEEVDVVLGNCVRRKEMWEAARRGWPVRFNDDESDEEVGRALAKIPPLVLAKVVYEALGEGMVTREVSRPPSLFRRGQREHREDLERRLMRKDKCKCSDTVLTTTEDWCITGLRASTAPVLPSPDFKPVNPATVFMHAFLTQDYNPTKSRGKGKGKGKGRVQKTEQTADGAENVVAYHAEGGKDEIGKEED